MDIQTRMNDLFSQIQNGKMSWFDFYGNLQQDQYANLANPGSSYYKSYANMLQKTTPNMGTDSFLAALTAGGGGSAGSFNVASEKAKQFQAQRNDSINNAVTQFALGGQQNALSLLDAMQKNSMNKGYNEAEIRASNNFGSQLLNMVGGVGGSLLGKYL